MGCPETDKELLHSLQTGSVLAGWGPPSAAIKLTFPSNAGELRLYAVDDTGGIREWGRNSQGWFNLGLIGGGAAKVGTVISAIEESGAVSNSSFLA